MMGGGTAGVPDLGGPLSLDASLATVPALVHHHGHPTAGGGGGHAVDDPAARMAMLMSQRNAMARARIVGQIDAPPSPVFRSNA